MKETHTSNTVLSQKSMKNQTDTIASGWLFTLFTNDTEQLLFKMQEKSLCFSLLLRSMMTINKKGRVHSFTRNADRHFQDLPVWHLAGNDRQPRDYRTRQNVRNNQDRKWETQYPMTAFQPRWKFAHKLLVNQYYYILAIINTADVTVSMNT